MAIYILLLSVGILNALLLRITRVSQPLLMDSHLLFKKVRLKEKFSNTDLFKHWSLCLKNKLSKTYRPSEEWSCPELSK